MAEKSNKQYTVLSEALNNMAEGAKMHSSEENFPPTVNETSVTKLKTQLDTKRNEYDTAENTARLKYDEYNAVEKTVSQEYSKLSTTLYGFYGKANQIVGDFGLVPYKPTGKKGPRKTDKT